MGYENAPSTRLLATHCIFCSRPLVDAVSVEAGVGPDCRKKYGHSEAQGPADWDAVRKLSPEVTVEEQIEDARALCNRLTNRVAKGVDGPELIRIIEVVRTLGYRKLSETLTKAMCAVTITHKAGLVAVQVPWNEDWVNESWSIPGRHYIKAEKIQTFPLSSRPALWKALKKVFRGKVISTPKGLVAL